ncbi:MAG: nucleotidyltransferase family protein [Myxococcota bacterium]|jgi:glucose-1-phosphate thymidylyltransferase|nr:nucleotidyltransferase family protein [Myxococcota bacterium]
MRAILLAAGYATRLYPLTRDRPKPLLEVGGRPLLDHLLDRVLELDGLRDVTVVTNHRFAEHFQRWAEQLDCAVPLRIVDDGTTSEDDRLGAIGDIAFVLEQPGAEPDDSWLVAAGDNLLELDLRTVQREFAAKPAPRILVRDVDHTGGPSPYNDVLLDDDGRVVGFTEKPKRAEGKHAAIAVYFFPPSLPGLLERYFAQGGNPDAPGYFVEWLCREEAVYASPMSGRWFDIGSHETLEEARREFDGAQGSN